MTAFLVGIKFVQLTRRPPMEDTGTDSIRGKEVFQMRSESARGYLKTVVRLASQRLRRSVTSRNGWSRDGQVVLLVLVCYFLFGLGRAFTTTPWNDEAWYSSPSWSLIHRGTTGTPLLETAGQFWQGINSRTYWVVPLQFFVQVPWFKAFGFSLLSARLFALSWGWIGICCWGLFVRRLTRCSTIGVYAMLLLATDYQFVSQTALDRMDAMSLGLASLGLLAYVELRERHLSGAVFVSQCFVAACGLTHPTPAIPAFCGVVFLALYYDQARITWELFFLATIPYWIFAAGWWWYIRADPQMFYVQFVGNVTSLDRLGGFAHPLQAVLGEVRRHIDMSGFAPRMSPFYKVRSLAVVIYLVAAASLLLSKSTRRDPRIRPLLGLWLVYVASMTFYENTKEVKYAVHLVPVYNAVVAVWLVSIWHKRVNRWVPILAAFVFFLVNTGGLIYTTLKDDYHKEYLPVADFLKSHSDYRDLILAESKFGFAMGFDRNIVDDVQFGFTSHKRPRYIVLGPRYEVFTESYRHASPLLFDFIQTLLARSYEEVFRNRDYKVLRSKEPRVGNNEAKRLEVEEPEDFCRRPFEASRSGKI
jgi:hypothetical protein